MRERKAEENGERKKHDQGEGEIRAEGWKEMKWGEKGGRKERKTFEGNDEENGKKHDQGEGEIRAEGWKEMRWGEKAVGRKEELPRNMPKKMARNMTKEKEKYGRWLKRTWRK